MHIILNKSVSQHVFNFLRLSDSNIMLQLNANTGRMEILQVDVPTADKEEEEIETFKE